MTRVLGTIVTRIEESLRVKFAIPRVRTVMKVLVIDGHDLESTGTSPWEYNYMTAADNNTPFVMTDLGTAAS